MGIFQYRDYSDSCQRCFHVALSKRVYSSILSEVFQDIKNETGGVLLGNIVNGIWYVVDSVDPGLNKVTRPDFFQWDTEYVNHLVEKLASLYRFPLTILGFWHKHPGSMDYFTEIDERAIYSNLVKSRFGLLSMIVNIDPELRMSFYYCWNNCLSRVRYDVGDEYFPQELLEYASPEIIVERIEDTEVKEIGVVYNKVFSSEAFPRTLYRNIIS